MSGAVTAVAVGAAAAGGAAYLGATTLGIAAAGLAGAATGSMVETQRQMAKAQNLATDQQRVAQNKALAQAEQQEQMSQMEMNKANRRSPDAQDILARAGGGVGGPAGTMLTGTQGVDPAALQLGKNTLLGG